MGTTSEKLTYLNTTKTLIKEELNLGGANITNEPFRAYKGKLEGIYKDFLANGTDTLWNNWLPKVTGSGENITLNNTIQAKMDFVYKGNTSQTGTPTPDTPIPVQVVSGDNTINICGKNLFNKNTITTSAYLKEDGTLQTGTGAEYITSDFIPVQPNTTYYKTQTLSPRTKFYDANKQVLDNSTYQDISIGGNAGSFTTPSNAYYFRFTGNVNTSTGININNVMVHKGSEATTYEAYTGASYPINIGNIELCKIGTYQDSIVKDNGKWYLNKQIGKITLSNSDNFILDSYSQRFTKVLDTTYEKEGYSNRYIYGGTYQTTGKFEILNNGRLAFSYPSSNIDTVAKLQTYLTTNELYMYLPLSNSTTTEITDTTLISQLEAIKKSYNTQTNISQENSKEAFILDVTALGN